MIAELQINLKGRCSGSGEVPSWNILAETEENHEKLLIVGVLVETQTEHLRSTSRECYHYANSLYPEDFLK
jgi:hypothetical protein